MTLPITPERALFNSLQPRKVIRFPIDPNTHLPCHGKWYFFDAEVATDRHRDLCRTCPALEWCFQWAIANDEHGIWAGTDRDQRHELMKGRV